MSITFLNFRSKPVFNDWMFNSVFPRHLLRAWEDPSTVWYEKKDLKEMSDSEQIWGRSVPGRGRSENGALRCLSDSKAPRAEQSHGYIKRQLIKRMRTSEGTSELWASISLDWSCPLFLEFSLLPPICSQVLFIL